jgi:hypothetical protein
MQESSPAWKVIFVMSLRVRDHQLAFSSLRDGCDLVISELSARHQDSAQQLTKALI